MELSRYTRDLVIFGLYLCFLASAACSSATKTGPPSSDSQSSNASNRGDSQRADGKGDDLSEANLQKHGLVNLKQIRQQARQEETGQTQHSFDTFHFSKNVALQKAAAPVTHQFRFGLLEESSQFSASVEFPTTLKETKVTLQWLRLDTQLGDAPRVLKTKTGEIGAHGNSPRLTIGPPGQLRQGGPNGLYFFRFKAEQSAKVTGEATVHFNRTKKCDYFRERPKPFRNKCQFQGFGECEAPNISSSSNTRSPYCETQSQSWDLRIVNAHIPKWASGGETWDPSPAAGLISDGYPDPYILVLSPSPMTGETPTVDNVDTEVEYDVPKGPKDYHGLKVSWDQGGRIEGHPGEARVAQGGSAWRYKLVIRDADPTGSDDQIASCTFDLEPLIYRNALYTVQCGEQSYVTVELVPSDSEAAR